MIVLHIKISVALNHLALLLEKVSAQTVLGQLEQSEYSLWYHLCDKLNCWRKKYDDLSVIICFANLPKMLDEHDSNQCLPSSRIKHRNCVLARSNLIEIKLVPDQLEHHKHNHHIILCSPEYV